MQFWNAFDGSGGGQPIQNVLTSNEKQVPVLCASDADKPPASGVYEVATSLVNLVKVSPFMNLFALLPFFQVLNNDANVRTPEESECMQSGLSSQFNMAPNNFPLVSAVVDSFSFLRPDVS